MTYRYVQNLSTDDSQVRIDGTTFPAPSILADEDGMRVLAISAGQERLLPSVWVQAYEAGIAMLLRVHGDDDYSVLTAEQAMEGRVEHHTEGTLEAVGWRPWPAPGAPSFAEVLVTPTTAERPPATGSGPTVAPSGRRLAHLHVHSEYSAKDGTSRLMELARLAAEDGQPALAITDHGMVSGHPDLQRSCDAYGIKPIFGMEAYFQPDRFRRAKNWEEVDPETGKTVRKSDASEARWGYWHLTLLAMTQQGLRNLWAMSSEAFRDGFYDKMPRLDWDTLDRLGEGVIATSGCLNGPICDALKKGDEDGARQLLARLQGIFGDRFYIELGAIDIPEQVEMNHKLVALARETGTPMIVAVDSHYEHEHDKGTHKNWLRMQPSINEDSYMITEHNFEPFRTAGEVEKAIAYLGEDVVDEAMANTVVVAERCTARVLGALSKPVFSRGGTREERIQKDVDRLIKMCLDNWSRKVKGKSDSQRKFADRFAREMGLLQTQEFCGYFLVTADLVRFAKSEGILCGPCRGSAGASLVAYLCDITEIDPMAPASLPFERFLTEERTEMPDIDLDFPSSKRGVLQAYAKRRWGDDHVVLVGNHIRAAPKLAIRNSARVLGAQGYAVDHKLLKNVTKVIDQYAGTLAGQTPKWDDIWELFGEQLEPARAAMPEVFELAGKIVRLLDSYGTHAAGLVISTDESLADLPTRVDDNGRAIAQFDYRDLGDLGLIKYDLLTLRTLDTIQDTIDLIEKRTGRRINPYDWREEYEDPLVWDELSNGHTLGVFQIETKAGRQMTRRLRPQSIAELSAIMALNRPGPLESGLAESYLRRRFGEEDVTYADPRLIEILEETYGAIIYQEQIMEIAVKLAGYGLGEADLKIRKVLGKKLVEKAAAAGEEFVRRAVEHGTDKQVAEQLWDGIAKFARYSFNKAHSWGYAVLAYWTAWLKVSYPLEFLTAALSTVGADRVPEFVDEARRMGYRVLAPDANESGMGFTPTDLVVRWGLAAVKGIGEVPAAQIVAHQPYSSYEDFVTRVVEPKGSKVNRGHLMALVRVGAFDSLFPHRRALEMQLEAEVTGEAVRCTHKDETVLGVGGLPCKFDWANEPDAPTVYKGRGKAKQLVLVPPPSRCTVKCRQYRKPSGFDADQIPVLTDDDIMERERELLQVWLSKTPFDRVAEEDLINADGAAEIETGKEGQYVAVAIVTRVNTQVDRFQNTYAWLTFRAPDGEFEAVCWSKAYAKYEHRLRPDALVAVVLNKNSRGVEVLSAGTI